MACCSHTSTQDSQPRHSSARAGVDLPSCRSYTSTGQVSTHSPQPVHLSVSTVTFQLMTVSSNLVYGDALYSFRNKFIFVTLCGLASNIRNCQAPIFERAWAGRIPIWQTSRSIQRYPNIAGQTRLKKTQLPLYSLHTERSVLKTKRFDFSRFFFAEAKSQIQFSCPCTAFFQVDPNILVRRLKKYSGASI